MKLNVEAVDNHGNAYGVSLENGKAGVILVIDGTPGRWYLGHLIDNTLTRATISIDHGRDWHCVNFDRILKSALRQLSKMEV